MPPQIETSIDVIASALEPVTPALGRMSSPDGAITLMLSDIADADVAAQQLGAERWEQLCATITCSSSRLVARHDGQVVEVSSGDGFLASFDSAHAGLHAAVDLQRTFSGAPRRRRIAVGPRSGFTRGS